MLADFRCLQLQGPLLGTRIRTEPKLETQLRSNATGLQAPQTVAGSQHPGHRPQGSLGIVVCSFGSNPLPAVKFQPNLGPQLPASLAAARGVFTFSWRGAAALGPRHGPRRLNNKRGAAKRQEDRTMSKGPGPGGSAASSAPPAATAQVLQAQPEKPQHYTYLKEFRTEQCPLFVQHKCTQHRPYTCFHWHFVNQRRRRSIRRRDGTFNYSPDVYCTKYDEATGLCPEGDE